MTTTRVEVSGGWDFSLVPVEIQDDPEVGEAGLRLYTALRSWAPGTELEYSKLAARAKSKDKDHRLVKKGLRELHEARWAKVTQRPGRAPLVHTFSRKADPDTWAATNAPAGNAPRKKCPPSHAQFAPQVTDRGAENAPISAAVYRDTRARELEPDKREAPPELRKFNPSGNLIVGEIIKKLEKQRFLGTVLDQAGELFPAVLQSFALDPYWRSKGWPVAGLLKQLPEYLAKVQTLKLVTAPPTWQPLAVRAEPELSPADIRLIQAGPFARQWAAQQPLRDQARAAISEASA